LTFATNQKLSDSARDCGTVLVTRTFGVKQCIYFMIDPAVAGPITV